jgi:hypothetical protein
MSDQTPQDPYAVPPAGGFPPPPPPDVPPIAPPAPPPVPAPGAPAGGYPAPPPPGYPAPTFPAAGYPGGQAPKQGAGALSIVALVIAIVALIICWIPFLGAGAALIALVLGIVAWVSAKKASRPAGLAIAATLIAGFALLVGVVLSIAVVAFLGDKIDSYDEADRYCRDTTATQADYDICMQEKWLGIDTTS